MSCDVHLKVDKETCIKIVNNQINKLNKLDDISAIKNEFNNITKNISSIVSSRDIVGKLESKSMYQENEYSVEKTRESILKARERVIDYLKDFLCCIEDDYDDYSDEFSRSTAILIIKKILNNFYMHIESMYECEVHKKAGITKENLDKIKIVNEYDVQRILYSIIKPIFPEARLEVQNDTGFGAVRYDIIIEKFSIIVEVKCSRKSMTERTLTEEIGSDIVHYKGENIFFFIYDKEKIIKNVTAFTNTYTSKFDSKNINAIVIQPRIL